MRHFIGREWIFQLTVADVIGLFLSDGNLKGNKVLCFKERNPIFRTNVYEHSQDIVGLWSSTRKSLSQKLLSVFVAHQ